MSYLRRASGGFQISPPLAWCHYRDYLGARQGATTPSGYALLQWVEDTETRNTPEGELRIRTAVRLEPAAEELWDDPGLEIGSAVNVAARAGVRMIGTIYVVGDDGPLDTWRYWCDDGGLHRDQAILVWPNGRRAFESRPRSELPGQERLGGNYLALSDNGPVAWDTPIDPERILRESPWQR